MDEGSVAAIASQVTRLAVAYSSGIAGNPVSKHDLRAQTRQLDEDAVERTTV
jgi:hypothetical protein